MLVSLLWVLVPGDTLQMSWPCKLNDWGWENSFVSNTSYLRTLLCLRQWCAHLIGISLFQKKLKPFTLNYQKAMDVVNIGSRLNNQPDISPVHFLSYCNFANYKYYKQKCICTREKQEVLAVTWSFVSQKLIYNLFNIQSHSNYGVRVCSCSAASDCLRIHGL